jgi:predicted NAD/FAD-binding protein
MVKAAGCEAERFDAVFLACHSNQALTMLSDASGPEREVLGAIPYQENEAVLHTDIRMLPQRRLAWAAWNYHVPDGRHKDDNNQKVALTYHMGILQSLESAEPFLVTLNRSHEIDPAKVIRRIRYEHPLFTPAAVAAQARQEEINGPLCTYFCGAYWRNGFHEDGVVSALAALKHFRERRGDAQRTLHRAA